MFLVSFHCFYLVQEAFKSFDVFHLHDFFGCRLFSCKVKPLSLVLHLCFRLKSPWLHKYVVKTKIYKGLTWLIYQNVNLVTIKISTVG